MQRNRFGSLIITVLLLTALPCLGSLHLGIKVANTQTHHYWLLTPSPECGVGNRWICFIADGISGTYTPKEDPEGFIMVTRYSLTPMVRLPWKQLFLSAGYGVSGVFRRAELHAPSGALLVTSVQSVQGTFRANAGFRIPLKPDLSCTIGAEYLYIDRKFRSFSVGAGVAVSPGRTGKTEKSAGPREEIRRAERLFETPDIKPAPRDRINISKICVIRNMDPIADELNSAIEVALIQAGYQITHWDKITSGVEPPLPSLSPSSNEGNADGSARGLQIALEKHASLNFSTAVVTSLRYTFKAYGGDVLVQSAYVKIIDLSTGDVLWAGDFNVPDASFIRCKQKLSEQTVMALKSLR
jgi:hypothetical protein